MDITRTIRHATFVLAIVATILTAAISCDDGRSYDAARPVNVDGWDSHDSLTFAVGHLPAETYRINLGFRATTSYPYKELGFTIVTHSYPSGKISIKKVKCRVFDDQGRIEGNNGISASDFNYRIGDLTVSADDSTVITVTHNMSQTVLQGITGVGITLSK